MTDFTQTLNETLGTEDLDSQRVGGLQNLEGIANVSYSNVTTLTWETTSDWDNAVSETGVVHEAYTDNNADEVRAGYPSTDEGGSNLLAYYPSDEDSGSTLTDVTGNGRDMSLNGASVNSELNGPLNFSAIDYDGTDDYAVYNGPNDSYAQYTVAMWIRHDSFNDSLFDNTAWGIDAPDFGNDSQWGFDSGNTDWRCTVRMQNSDSIAYERNDSISTGQWYFVVFTFNQGDVYEVYVDGSSLGADSVPNSQLDVGSWYTAVDALSENDFADVTINHIRVYNRFFQQSDVDTLYNGVLQNANLLTNTKSFSSSQSPDLVGLDYDLNSADASIDVIGSPGGAGEETVSQTLDGSTSYPLSWSSGHTDFRVRLNFNPINTDNPVTSPVIRSVGLQP